MEKLIFKSKRKSKDGWARTVRVSNESMEILEEIAERTDLPKHTILNKIIAFANEYIEIEE